MKVAIVFEPDPDLGPDPLDEARTPRRLGEFLDSDKVDVFVAWREFGDEFATGMRTNLVGGGAWDNLSDQQRDQIFEWLTTDGLG